MTLSPRVISIAAPLLVVLLLCGFGVEPARRPGYSIVVTTAPIYEPLAALRGGERFPKGAQLLFVSNGKVAPLIEGYAATADANVSFDGKRLLFAGKRNASDNWSIWEFTFDDRSVHKVMAGDTDVIRPLYLPDDRLVYSRRTAHGFQLEGAKLDGSNLLSLTYMSASALPETVLADGRILFQAGFPLGTAVDRGAVPEMFIVYSDGSGVESYRCDHGTPRWGGSQLASGDIVFTHGPRLARFTSPLAAEVAIATPHAEFAGAIAETESGQWLMSARSAPAARYSLKLWKPGAPAIENLLSRNVEDVVEPVLVAPRTRPNRHPSGLHKWDYANLLALDARQSRDGALKETPTVVRVEEFDDAGNVKVLGTSPVESDGSFFVKVPADTPIRFALLDEKGSALREEHGWFWIRKGEQRYCVGCHAGPEHAPENRVPQVLLRTTTPVDLTGSRQQAVPGGQ